VESCPTPTKIRFFSRKDAKEWKKHGSKKYAKRISDVRVYKCRCGFFHLGNLTEKAKREGRSEVYG
jgi:hypothetical protein